MLEYAYLLFITMIAASMLSTAALQLVLAWVMIRANLSQKPQNLCQIEDAPEGPAPAMRSKLMQPSDMVSTASFADTKPAEGFGDKP